MNYVDAALTGYVGIGTTAPRQQLDVVGNVVVGASGYPYYAALGSSNLLNPPSSSGTINGVNITALNKRTRASYASAVECVKTWTARTSAADNSWYSVCWAPELPLFVAVAVSGTGNRVMTSPDGINWTARTSAANNDWNSMCWAPELSLFVAVADAGTGNRVMTSPDGINWTVRTSAADNNWRSVCWSPERSLFVAVATSGTGNRVMTSPDGINWTARTSATDNQWLSVCWSPELSLFAAVAQSGTGNRVMTSPDGISWSTRTSAADNNWYSMCWSPELSIFVAVAYSGAGNRVMTSPDGINWTARTSAADNGWLSVCWARELSIFVAVAFSGAGNRVMTSPDGINWTARTSAADNTWRSVCWAPELSIFAAVADSGTGNRVMTSAIGMPNARSVVKALPSQMTVDANGNVGIGTTNPQRLLVINAPFGDTGSYPVPITDTLSFSNTTERVVFSMGATNHAGGGASQGGVFAIKTRPQSISGATLPIERFRIDDNGYVGIGTASLTHTLTVNGTARVNVGQATANKLLVLWDGNPTESTATATNFNGFGINSSVLRLQVDTTTAFFRFYGGATQFGYVDNGTGFVNTFTGQHRSFPESSLAADPKRFVGLIACASGRHVSVNDKIPVTGKAAITISETVPSVHLSTVECDPTVFGVISDVEDPNDRKDHYGCFVATQQGMVGDTRLFINSLGEGAIWVCDSAGPLTNGDYITSSAVPGYGAKQADAVLKNYTVGKATMDCDFTGTPIPARCIKKKTETKTVSELVQTERIITEDKEVVEYDDATQRYIRKKITESRTVMDTVYDEFDLYDRSGAVVGKHKVERYAQVTKTTVENDLDAHGNIQWVDATDADGAPVMEAPYDVRYLAQDGNEITFDDYTAQKADGVPVYRAAFIGCTYHCG